MPEDTLDKVIVVKRKFNILEKINIFSKIRSRLPTDKRKLSLLIIILAIPITVGLALVQQEIRSRASGPDRKLVMGMSVYQGGYESRYSAAKTLGIIDGVASRIGQYPGTWSIWTDFGDGNYTNEVNDASPKTRNTFPSMELLNGLTARNISPVIFMQSVGGPVYGVGDANSDPAAKRYSNASIAAGSFDAYFTKWANDAKAYNKPVMLRYDQEMNGKWFPWSPPVEGHNLKNFKNLHNTPENFIASWRHIYNVIHPIAPKVKFFWCPIASDTGGSMAPYYPGDSYVDYAGFDAYEKPDSIARTMLDRYDDPIKKLRTFSNKPIIIGETGVDVNFPNRRAWLANGYPAIYNNFPDIKAIIYFNMSNWDLSASPEIKSAYINLAAQPRFQGRFAPFTASPLPTTPTPTQRPSPTSILTPTPTFTPTPTPTPTKQLIAIADTWAEKDQATVNNGSSERMKSDGDPVQISYIKFDLSSLSGIDIQKAFLRLKVSSNVNAVSSLSPGMSVKIILDNSWNENSINYNNRPALGNTLITVTGAQQNGDFVEIDLTDFIKDKAGGIISLGLWNLGSDGIAFNTREASFGKPTLIINYR